MKKDNYDIHREVPVNRNSMQSKNNQSDNTIVPIKDKSFQ